MVAFLASLVLLAGAFDLRSWLAAGAALLVIVLFSALVVRHHRQRRQEIWLGTLAQLNREGLLRLDRDWAGLPARPALTNLTAHNYGDDLDLFGQAALAQLLGPTSTIAGQSTLESWLLRAAPPAGVRERQEAVRELADAIDWRDTLAGHARQTAPLKPAELAAFLDWAESAPWLSGQRALHIASWSLPAINWTLLLLDIWLPTTRWWLISVFITFVLGLRVLPRVHRTFARAFTRESLLAHYPELLRCLTEQHFRAPLLQHLQSQLQVDGQNAYQALVRLQRLMHLADLRLSSLHQPVQWFSLSDLHVLRALERWQAQHGSRIRNWLEALGQLEALAALATLAHDQPDWVYPQLDAAHDRLQAQDLGHPLLRPERRVDNTVTVGPAGSFLFVTGSNMSGKSTLLRALGINTVLAQAGAPVCARAMQLMPAELHTAIRVQDSLARGVSYFMAELERLKSIVDAATRRHAATMRGEATEPTVLFLLDEVLHGTNSAERRVAARLVIRQLVDLGALGAVTSHDLDLATGSELNGRAVDVHFREHFRAVDGRTQMEFDYVLRPGLAPTTNALQLLALVGLAK